MRSRISLLLLAGALAGPSCSLVGDVVAGPRGHASFGAYSGTMAGKVVSAVGPAVGVVDLEQAGVGGRVLSSDFGVQAGWGGLDLTVSGYSFSQQSVGFVLGSFLGTTFPGPVSTDLEIQNLRALLGYNVVDTDIVRAGVLAGVDLYSVDLVVRDVLLLGLSESLDETLPVPVVGLRLEGQPLDVLLLSAQAHGMAVNTSGFDASLLTVEVGARAEPLDHVEVFLGWRHTATNFDGTTDGGKFVDADLTLSGPFFGVGATF